jgi:hypothetical protein
MELTLSPRIRRFAAWSLASLVVTAIYYYWTPATPAVVAPVVADSVASAQKTLDRLRVTASTVPQREEILKNLQGELSKREAGFITGDTAAQAQAQLLQNLRKLCASASPPIEIRNVELGQVVSLGDAYGAANVAIQIDCPIEQLVNLLTTIADQPELIYTNELRLTSQNNPKEKLVSVRIGVIGVVPRALVPGKAGDKPGKASKKGTGI